MPKMPKNPAGDSQAPSTHKPDSRSTVFSTDDVPLTLYAPNPLPRHGWVLMISFSYFFSRDSLGPYRILRSPEIFSCRARSMDSPRWAAICCSVLPSK